MNKLMGALIAGGCLAVLLACGGTRYYTKPGATTEDFYSDRAACQAQARAGTAAQNNPFIAASEANDIAHLCLEGKGWRQTSAPQNQ